MNVGENGVYTLVLNNISDGSVNGSFAIPKIIVNEISKPKQRIYIDGDKVVSDLFIPKGSLSGGSMHILAKYDGNSVKDILTKDIASATSSPMYSKLILEKENGYQYKPFVWMNSSLEPVLKSEILQTLGD